MIIYGRGLIAEEYCRYLERQGHGKDIIAFAVTCLGGQGDTYCSRPCLEIGEALERFPQAEVHLALQEKYHGEVLALLGQRGRLPTEIIGLHRMTEVLLTIPRLTFPNVHKYFTTLPVTTMDEQDFQLMLRLIEQEDSELTKFSKDFLEGQIHYPNNMVIAKRDIYLDYGNFMFKVLQGMQAHYAREGISRPDRYLGYVGELLTTVYFAYHRGAYRTAFIDYRLLNEI